ncbi:ribosome small subunit-dependent GTPase A [Caldisalinibacter kiritimatiensis]|uniref:Small ribosomal subunit biogenesis GTPase RsgA n=1 Tax=Caldisalinibacter kiritimatiensis TaxID=1304284 RepID=R1CRM0_9FIRM|nr:ribosome small subunit-dependent GTPase A [Caldisalinibacter kiritimatiensis]EOD01321.1 Ribosome small subunit-stimulated GTPase EngC [Caldisalinibacter kiritimatiensis]
MNEGIIIKGVGGFYYVKAEDKVIECRARGVFRKNKITPLVGDRVQIRISDEDNTGYIEKIFERKSELIRPPVANVNHALFVFAVKHPNPNLWLLDRFLLLAMKQNLDVTICFNKIDLATEDEVRELSNIYIKAGYKVITSSKITRQGINKLKETLKDKITVLAGPSGVGKSTLLNNIQPNLQLKTGEISKKTKRGKHTTRYAELLELDFGGWVVDTPGFSSLDIDFVEIEDLDSYFKDICRHSVNCKFNSCRHNKEPNCGVKEAVEKGEISRSRYENYLMFLEELEKIRRY